MEKTIAKKLAEELQPCMDCPELVYVSDRETGIVRVPKGKGFAYFYNGRELKDRDQLDRIRKLAIPPAWRDVWICKDPNGHMQATGLDARNRKQYRYHSEWQESRNRNKFEKLLEFGKLLPKLRTRIKKDIARRSLTEEKVIATVLSVMENTYIRIGNGYYEKNNKSYGLTTLKNRHVSINGSTVQFSFIGKKGIAHRISLKDRRLARIVKQCREIPGKELFQYIDEDGHHKPIDSGKVNQYIKEATHSEFTTKDLRTWAGTINALLAFQELGEGETATAKKHNILHALDAVSRKLGNTRTVCKKYYVHPLVIELYENGLLKRYFPRLKKNDAPAGAGLSQEEKVLMKILRQAG
jgi:DNA topoisomerase I